MASGFLPRNKKLAAVLLLLVLQSTVATVSSSSLILLWNNVTLSFNYVGANFAPPVTKSPGLRGRLFLADPLDACSVLTNKIQSDSGNLTSPFALIVRGGCSFEDKVRRAQKAGFKAAIVYDNVDGNGLIAMAGNPGGIRIHALFISKAAGEKLKEYTGYDDAELWLMSSADNSAWSIMAISFISLLAMSAVLATCFFVRRHRVRREGPQLRVREFHGMSGRLVKAMPSLVFTAVLEDNSTSATCAICLEDYKVGEKIRVLPCKHKFHAICVDCWLTSWRTFCPVCKQDARTATGIPPASESTPLLYSNPSSVASSPQSSIRSSHRSSSAIQIINSPSPRSNRSSYAISSHIPRSTRPHQRYIASPSPSRMSVSRSSIDLQNLSAHTSVAQMAYPHSSSIGYPSISPLNSRSLLSPYTYCSSLASSSNLAAGHSGRNPLHYSESAASFSPYASAHSLSGCSP